MEDFHEGVVVPGARHSLADIRNFLLDSEDRRPFAIFGAGESGRLTRRWLEERGARVVCFFDNDARKEGGTFDGLEVLAPRADRLAGMRVVISSLHFVPISRQLIEHFALRPCVDFVHYSRHDYYADMAAEFDAEIGRGFDAYFAAHREEFERVLSLLEDDASKAVYRSVLRFRSLILDVERLGEADLPLGYDERARMRADVERHRQQLRARLPEPLDDWMIDSIALSLSAGHYLRGGELAIEPGSVVLDIGAFCGDSAALFASVEGDGTVYAFEPGEVFARPLRVLAALYPNVVPVPSFISDRDEGEARIESVDGFVRRMGLERVDFIKMDIEGEEIRAIDGAVETIGRFRPNLAICIYHRAEHLWKIPLMIKARWPEYRLFVEHREDVFVWGTVLYALRD
ncbi:FkbM family methyltransferase [Endothiovibrio diazotrophicus]